MDWRTDGCRHDRFVTPVARAVRPHLPRTEGYCAPREGHRERDRQQAGDGRSRESRASDAFSQGRRPLPSPSAMGRAPWPGRSRDERPCQGGRRLQAAAGCRSHLALGIRPMTNKKTILFIHRNFPGQFRHIADHLARSGHKVFAASGRGDAKIGTFVKLPSGVQIIGYRPQRRPNPEIHSYLHTTEEAILEGQGLANAAIHMRKMGIFPDIIVAHSGWGSGSFSKTVWPDAKFVQYLEWWYEPPETSPADAADLNAVRIVNARAQTLCRNIPFMVDAVQADAILSPSAFQSEDVPEILRSTHILQVSR